MFDKFTTHLKNMIFFKTILIILAISLFYACTPILLRELQDTQIKHQKATNILQNVKLKLSSMTNFTDKIPGLVGEYELLKKKSANNDCFDRQDFIHQITKLNDKYSLFSPIIALVSRELNQEESQYSIHRVRLNKYEIQLNFSSKDTALMLLILADIYQLLPPGAIIIDINIAKQEGLDFGLIDRLNVNNSPGLLQTSIRIQLKEIIYAE